MEEIGRKRASAGGGGKLKRQGMAGKLNHF